MGLLKLKKSLLLATLTLAPFSQYAGTTNASDSERLVRSIDEFTFDLHKKCSNDYKSNMVISPFSVYSALSLVYQGARGPTSLQMAKTMHLPYFGEKLGIELHSLQSSMWGKRDADGYVLTFGNSVWFNFDTVLQPQFVEVAENCYNAKIENLDFDNKQIAAGTINQWVSNQTQGKIDKLIQIGDITSSTKMMIVNTVFFDGSWIKPFYKNATSKDTFHSPQMDYENVLMMDQTEYFRYTETESYQMIAMPFKQKNYANSELAFVLALPKTTRSIGQLGDELNAFEFMSQINNFEVRKIHIKMPKICMTIRQNLESKIGEMGMPLAFSKNADFSGMSSNQNLTISNIIHQAYFIADEDGVCAAAATAIGMAVTCVKPAFETPIDMIANRPFMFFIVDLKSQAILFSGNYITPNQVVK